MFWKRRKKKAVEPDPQPSESLPQTDANEEGGDGLLQYTGVPYIPVEHRHLDLLPRCRRDSEEVFCYPAELDRLNEALSRLEKDPGKIVKDRLGPHDSKNAEEFCNKIKFCAQVYRDKDRDLYEDLMALAGIVKRMNVKEEWSVVRYIGAHFDDDPLSELFDLTKGRCYYWPCSSASPTYQGVFDNEETVPYLYPCDSESWEVVLDPTGMATTAIEKGASPVTEWVRSSSNESQDDKSCAEGYVSAKKARRSYACEWANAERWPATVVEHIELPCPECGFPFDYEMWMLINARDNMEYAKVLANGGGFYGRCTECGSWSTFLHPILFLDPDHRSLAFLALDSEDTADFEAALDMYGVVDGWDGPQGGRRRIAKSHEEFRSIVAASLAGLDDRALPILLVQVLREAKECGDLPIGCTFDWFFYQIDKDSDGDSIVVFKAHDDGKDYLLSASRDGYSDIVKALEKSSIRNLQPYYMDKEWAYKAIDLLLEEGLLSEEDF